MKRSNAVVLGAVLSAAMVAAAAADAALIISDGNESFTTNLAAPHNAGTTVVIVPNSAWKPTVGQGAEWVSYRDGTGGGGSGGGPTVVAPPNTQMIVTESFNLGAATALSIQALADDFANIRILNSLNAVVYSFTSTNPGNSTCSTAPIGCINANQLNDVTAILAAGLYTFEMTAFQTNAVSFGVNYAVSVVPLPGAALLFGTALAGLGWMRRRRQEAEPVAAAA